MYGQYLDFLSEVRRFTALIYIYSVCLQIVLGFMQFGFVAIYLSESFVRGFMTAAGLQIFISVLKYLVGVHVPPYSGPLAVTYVSDFHFGFL